MKRYHEVAHVLKNNERVGFVLYDCESDVSKLVTAEEFEYLVEQCEVQYFVKTAFGLQVAYTSEELKQIGKLFDDDYLDLDKYFERDMKVPYEIFEVLRQNPQVTLGICAAPAKLPLVGTVIPVHLLCERGITAFIDRNPEYSRHILKQNLGISTFMYGYKEMKNDTAGIFNNMLMVTEVLHRDEAANLVDVEKKRHKIFNPLVKGADTDDVLLSAKMFDSITKQTLAKLAASDERNYYMDLF